MTPGPCFCIEGYQADGHDYAAAAVEKGAAAVLLRKDIPLPENYEGVCGITQKRYGLCSSQLLQQSLRKNCYYLV